MNCNSFQALRFKDYMIYFEYLPFRQAGFWILPFINDFRTAPGPPTHIRDRKMDLGGLNANIEEVLVNPLWPLNWPYSFEDFRATDYTRDRPINIIAQYHFTDKSAFR